MSNYILDSAVKALLAMAEQSGVPPLNEVPVDVARAQYLATLKTLGGVPNRIGDVSDRTIPGSDSSIPVRIYRPETTLTTVPALVFFHGGGWVIGDLESHDNVCRSLCRYSNCIIVAVDYRLAPEHKFPAAVDDAIAATQWVVDNAAELGVAKNRIAVGGDSAGGNMAAVVAQQAKLNSGPDLQFQLLVYPVIDMSLSSPSMQEFADGYRLTRPLMEWFVGHYLDDYDRDKNDVRASPILARELSGLPPALVVTAGFDPLRDEGKAYADKLQASGVATEYRCYDGMIHGFLTMAGALQHGEEALVYCGEKLKAALA